MIQINAEGNLTRHLLGPNISKGELLKIIVPIGIWQGTRLVEGGKWALVGCTCIPGFEFEDFEGGYRKSLSEKFPQHSEIIWKYTHS